MKKYLIFQFACFGDCLYATTIARQLKHDEPDCHVTWVIAKKYAPALTANPDVDEVMEVVLDPRHASRQDFDALERRIDELAAGGQYDEVFHVQVLSRRHMAKFCTTLRRTVFQIFGRPITVDPSPVLCTTGLEKKNVEVFAARHALRTFEHVILFECAPASGQSQVNPQWALEIARDLIERHPALCVILSSPSPIVSATPRIVDASALSFRENAELTHYCTLLIGCSSGITWLSTSTAARPLPMIQLLSANSEIFAGVSFDLAVNGLDNRRVIELTRFDRETVEACVTAVIVEGVSGARGRFHQPYAPGRADLRHNLRRLASLRFSFREMLGFAQRFVRENAAAGNTIKLGAWERWRMISQVWVGRAIYDAKAAAKDAVAAMNWRKRGNAA